MAGRELQPVPRNLALPDADNYIEQRQWLEELRTSINTLVIASGGSINGSGTAGFVSKFADSTTITDSLIFDTGSLIQVGGGLEVSGNIAVTGLVDGRDIAADGTTQDAHIADSSIHFTADSLDHVNLLNIGTNTHPQIDTHIADGTIHFEEGDIDHENIQNRGANSHNTIDTHIADGTIHFTEETIDHGNLAGLGDDDHILYPRTDGSRGFTAPVSGVTPVVGSHLVTKDYADAHIDDTSIHFTEASIDHENIQNRGANSHNTIDLHLADTDEHPWDRTSGVLTPKATSDDLTLPSGGMTIAAGELVLTPLATSNEYNFLRAESDGAVTQYFTPEQYVPISRVTSHDAPGEKGQWSAGSPAFQTDPNPSVWVCVAENTWIDCIDHESFDYLLDQWIATELPDTVEDIVYAFSDDQYLPSSRITDNNSSGKKGQWSYEGQYLYMCVASDTWVRYAVETDFTK